VSRWVALLFALVGGAIAAYTTILLIAGALREGLLIWVYRDELWPTWAIVGLKYLVPIGGLALWALFGWAIWWRLRGKRSRADG
jgi:hypothetical protein